MDTLKYEIEDFQDNKGFNYINLKVYINDCFAGYGMVRYVTEDSLKKAFPNGAYDFLYKNEYNHINIEKVTKEELRKASLPENWNTLNKTKRISFFNAEYGSSFKAMKKYFLNKPAFFYVRLYKEGEDINEYYMEDYGIQKKVVGISEVNYHNTGLGKFIYMKMAEILSENNLNLFSAQTLSEDSKRMWKSLNKNYNEHVEFRNNRYSLNGKDLQVIIPDWCQEESISFSIR